jgi:hypothetical protein
MGSSYFSAFYHRHLINADHADLVGLTRKYHMLFMLVVAFAPALSRDT